MSMEGQPMTEWHPDRETLESFLDDQLAEEQSRTLQRHIFTCSRCEERLIGILPAPACEGSEDDVDTTDRYRDLFRQVRMEARQEGEQRRVLLARERREAA